MKNTKSFQEYIEKRLTKEEITQINALAKLEIKILHYLQSRTSQALTHYLYENNLNIKNFSQTSNMSPYQITKIQKGQANLTFSSLAHLFALMGKEPSDIFKK